VEIGNEELEVKGHHEERRQAAQRRERRDLGHGGPLCGEALHGSVPKWRVFRPIGTRLRRVEEPPGGAVRRQGHRETLAALSNYSADLSGYGLRRNVRVSGKSS